jgi:hypothetical protein
METTSVDDAGQSSELSARTLNSGLLADAVLEAASRRSLLIVAEDIHLKQRGQIAVSFDDRLKIRAICTEICRLERRASPPGEYFQRILNQGIERFRKNPSSADDDPKPHPFVDAEPIVLRPEADGRTVTKDEWLRARWGSTRWTSRSSASDSTAK